MPKFLHHTFEGGGIAIWHIEESSEELYALLQTPNYDAQLKTKNNATRRAEWLAVRVLLAEVLGRDKIIAYHATGRPYLTDGSYHISISHTKGYAALAYHRTLSVGVDVEYVSSRVERIAHRFTNSDEELYINKSKESERMMYHLINWSVKETLYKWIDDVSAADFQKTFTVRPYALNNNGSISVAIHSPFEREVIVHYFLCKDFVCTWI